jgi:hypothetical protein
VNRTTGGNITKPKPIYLPVPTVTFLRRYGF